VDVETYDVVAQGTFDALRAKLPELEWTEFGEPSVASLSRLDPAAIVAAASKATDTLLAAEGSGEALSPPHWPHLSGVDDVLPQRSVLSAIAAGSAAGIPLIVGHNANEWPDFMRVRVPSFTRLFLLVHSPYLSPAPSTTNHLRRAHLSHRYSLCFVASHHFVVTPPSFRCS
jgi:hypothetical protein|tara:strand:- start:151 stop:666 length:516 start_codon:yes stop_codon:yes gene_type:complete